LARPAWSVLSDLLTALGDPTNFFLPADVFGALAGARPSFAGMTYDRLGLRGAMTAQGEPTRPLAGAAR
jgi:predicted molibdopterin-dependent oxidoreductase YjgC